MKKTPTESAAPTLGAQPCNHGWYFALITGGREPVEEELTQNAGTVRDGERERIMCIEVYTPWASNHGLVCAIEGRECALDDSAIIEWKARVHLPGALRGPLFTTGGGDARPSESELQGHDVAAVARRVAMEIGTDGSDALTRWSKTARVGDTWGSVQVFASGSACSEPRFYVRRVL